MWGAGVVVVRGLELRTGCVHMCEESSQQLGGGGPERTQRDFPDLEARAPGRPPAEMQTGLSTAGGGEGGPITWEVLVSPGPQLSLMYCAAGPGLSRVRITRAT